MIDGEINTQYSNQASNFTEYITIRQDSANTNHQTLQYEIKPKDYADSIRQQLMKEGFNLRSAQNNFAWFPGIT